MSISAYCKLDMFMKRNCRQWVAGGLVLANSLLWGAIAIPTSANAQERNAQEMCMDALNLAQSRILDNRTINLQVRAFDLSGRVGSPSDRPKGVEFRMADFSRPGPTPDGETILTSPVFMKSIATDVIDRCSTVSYVTFSAASTGWQVPHGLVNGTVEAFQCMERPEGRRGFTPPWGFYDCSI
jgi:hypothetical protein